MKSTFRYYGPDFPLTVNIFKAQGYDGIIILSAGRKARVICAHILTVKSKRRQSRINGPYNEPVFLGYTCLLSRDSQAW